MFTDVDDDGLRDSAFNSCLTVDYENMDSMSKYKNVKINLKFIKSCEDILFF